MKPNKTVILDELIKHIEKGKTFSEVLTLFCRKFQFTKRTFANYWKKASVVHQERQQALKDKMADIEQAAAIEARKLEVLTVNERKAFLSALIVKPVKLMKVAGSVQMVYEYEDADGNKQHELLSTDIKLKAMTELNRMCGDYAPTKVANTDKDGNDVPATSTPLSDAQFNKLIQTINAAKPS